MIMCALPSDNEADISDSEGKAAIKDGLEEAGFVCKSAGKRLHISLLFLLMVVLSLAD